MLKSAAFGAVAAVSLLAAVPANAQASADEVRVPVAGRTAVQLNHDIEAAADQVCQGDFGCYDAALRGAHKQLAAMSHAGDRPEAMRLTLLAGGVYAVRVSLVGKSPDQVDAAIGAAASAVCRPDKVGFEYAACVSTAERDAKSRLHAGVAEQAALY